MKYEISDSFIKERKKINLSLIILIIATICIMSYYYIVVKKIDNISLFMKIMSIMSIFLVAEMVIVSWLMLKKIKTTTLTINEDNFVRQGGKTKKSTEVINYDEITSVKVIKKPNNETVFIKLKLNKKRFNITGFDQMDNLVGIFKDKGIEIENKKWKFDWNSTAAIFGIGGITLVVILGLITFSDDLYNLFNKLFMIGFGAYILFGKVISKNMGKRFRILEYVLGILLIGLSIFNIIIG